MEKIIHQIWVGKYEIPNKEQYFLERIKKINPDFTHILWTDDNLPKLPDKVQELCNFFYERKDYAFVADVLRIFLIYEYGGIYLDIDTRPNYPISELNLENYNGFFPYHDEFNVANTFFGCKSKTSYINYVYENLINSKLGDHFFPYWFNKCVKEYYQVENLSDIEYFPIITEKCKENGRQLLSKWDADNICYLNINGNFSKYFQHFALHSWDGKHRKYFEENNINYCDDIYKLNYKLD